MRPGAKTLIIGPGGGWDVARALAQRQHGRHRRRDQPIIANTIMRERFRGAEQQSLPAPRRAHRTSRTAAVSSAAAPKNIQVLQATLVDTWAATAAGAFALSENNLYTTDAFRDYLLHLTDDGMLAITRWGFDPPRESLRLISLAIEALGQIGEKRARGGTSSCRARAPRRATARWIPC